MRIIVADDEFFARKALVKRIGELTEEIEEIEVCEEAEDGSEVMRLLEEYGADLVVTDIRMPDMDGLEVARQVQERFPDTSVIIESGYADFDYAATAIRDLVVTDIRMPDMDGLEVARQVQERFPDTSVIIESGYADFDYAATAIRYGVKDYLTKPVKKEELEKAIQRVKEERKKLKQKIEEQIAVHRGQFMDFSHVLENEAAAKEILRDMFLKMEEESWYLLAVQSGKESLSKEQIHYILEIFTQGEEAICGYYFYPKNEFILLLPVRQQERFPEEFFRKKLVECWNKTQCKIHLGVSQCHKKTAGFVKEAAGAYREAVYAMNQRLLQPEEQIYFYEAEVNVVQLFSQAEERELEKCLTEHRIQEAQYIVKRLFKQCENNEEVSIYSLFTSLIQIMNVINRVYTMKRGQESAESDKSSYLLFNFKADLYAFHSLEELQSYILDLLSDVSEEEGQKSSIIHR